MTLFVQAIKKESKSLKANGIKTCIIGDKTRFPSLLQDQIRKVEELTADCDVMRLNIAANYGGRWEILQAAKKLAQQCQDGTLNINELTEDKISQNLDIVTDVDLLVRTSGEQRISNFLIWQLSYAEMYFTNTYWPDFGEEDLLKAFDFYNGRERRFGMTSAQIQEKTTK